jgi:hypothetical protein
LITGTIIIMMMMRRCSGCGRLARRHCFAAPSCFDSTAKKNDSPCLGRIGSSRVSAVVPRNLFRISSAEGESAPEERWTSKGMTKEDALLLFLLLLWD